MQGFRFEGYRVQGAGYRALVKCSGFRAQSLGFRVQGSVFGVQTSGFRSSVVMLGGLLFRV